MERDRLTLNQAAVREWLRAHERSANWLARKAGIPRGTLSNLMRQNPEYVLRWSQVERLAAVMGVAPSSLIISVPTIEQPGIGATTPTDNAHLPATTPAPADEHDAAGD